MILGGKFQISLQWEGGSKKAENGWTSFVQAPLPDICTRQALGMVSGAMLLSWVLGTTKNAWLTIVAVDRLLKLLLLVFPLDGNE